MGDITFGTGGFRAIIGEDFTKKNVQKICQAICNLINKNSNKRLVCIGYDYRFMSETFAIWCAEVFAGNNLNVELFDAATATPVVMYATLLNRNDYGIMITASHNPYMYNGVKVFSKDGKDCSKQETDLIQEEIKNVKEIKTMDYKEAMQSKTICLANYLQSYITNIINVLSFDSIENDFGVVFDTMHGSSQEEIVEFCKRTGLTNYQIINSNRDAFFGFSTPAPSEINLDSLKIAVKENNARIGFALDADGDRLAVVDEFGNYIDNNYILAVAYYFFVKYCGMSGDSVKNVATSNLLNRVTEKFGHTCREVPVGFKYVSSALKEYNAVVGGESSGGLAIHGHIWGKDSLLAIAICLKVIAVTKKTFSQILDEVKDFVGGYDKVIIDKQFKYTNEKKQQIDKLLFEDKVLPKQRYQLKCVAYDDYVKIYYKNGNWSIIRFSGTEPILRIFAEADTKLEADQMIKDWQELLMLEEE